MCFKKTHLLKTVEPVTDWYRKNKRDLPWRHEPDAYRVWVSEIMLQQTRVEVVIGYYTRFLQVLPDVKTLAQASEDTLLKLWEGLGYYSRVRNMQTAARQILSDYNGRFPNTYTDLLSLKGIGSYTAGAICAFAYGQPCPAVDGNVLRVMTRLCGSMDDITKQPTKTKVEAALAGIIPADAAADYSQGLIELGALVCVPHAKPHCDSCPLKNLCVAQAQDLTGQIPVKSRAKARRTQLRTIFLFKDAQNVAIRKRPQKGLLAGLYEFPSVQGYLTQEEAVAYSKSIGLMPVRIRSLEPARHIFSHIEWQMTGYEIIVDELAQTNDAGLLFIRPAQIAEEYPIPSAFSAYAAAAGIRSSYT